MKIQNKKIIIGIITGLALISSICVIAPVFAHYTNTNSKNSILLSTASKYNTNKLLNNKNSESTNTIINNLTYINKYLNSTLIVKEKLLRLSILGGKYDKSDKYKNDKNKKRSELAQISHDLKHVHRYGDQVGTTIDNSTTSLTKESGVISQIIPLIQDHPYTYNSYLNKMNISIPNISFFINKDSSTSSNNLNSKTDDISNSSYGVNTNNTNLNSIAFSSEEDGTGAKTMYKSGSSIYAAVLTKISFQASIITFDKTTNSFKYETPTSKVAKTTKTSQSTKLDSDNSEFLNGNFLKINNSSYFDSSRIALSTINSSNNDFAKGLPVPVVPNYLPGYFNNQLSNAAEAKINYNGIRSFKNNNSLYYPVIFLPIFMPIALHTVGSIITSIAHIPISIKAKKQKRLLFQDSTLRLDLLDSDIAMQELTKDNYHKETGDTNDRFVNIEKSFKDIPLNHKDRISLLTRLGTAKTAYTNDYRKKARLLDITSQEKPDDDSDIEETSAVPTHDQISHKDQIEQIIGSTNQELENGDIKSRFFLVSTVDELEKSLQNILNPLDVPLKEMKDDVNFVAEQDYDQLVKQLWKCISSINTLAAIRRGELGNTIAADLESSVNWTVKPTDKQEANKHDINEDIDWFNNDMKDGTIPGLINNEQTADSVDIIATSLIHPLQDSITKIKTTKDFVAGCDKNNLSAGLQICIDKINNLAKIRKEQIAAGPGPESEENIQDARKDISAYSRIKEHKDKIDEFDEINDKHEFAKASEKILNELNVTDVYIKSNEFTNKFSKTWLTRNVKRLKTRFNSKAEIIIEAINNEQDVLNNINIEINRIWTVITMAPDNIDNIQQVYNCMSDMEDRIIAVVIQINIVSKSVPYNLRELDHKIKDLRTTNQDIGNKRMKELQQQYDSINNNLDDKRTHLKEQNDILDGTDKPTGGDKVAVLAKKSDLENEIHFLENDLVKIKTSKDNIAPFVARGLENVLFV